jgi:predicted O-linked N-acetylglucosamine transferase (SPINDLY family)
MVHAGTELATLMGAFAEAQARLGSGDHATAERICREILRLQPDDFAALYLLGIINAAARRHPQAADFLGRAAALRPDEPSTHNNLGNVLLELGRPEESLACFERALLLRADYAEAHYNRGNALRELQRLAEALEAYDRALLLKPQLAEAHNNRGKVLREQRRFDEARSSFARAVQLSPGNAQALTNLGVALGELGRPEEALAAHERAIELAADSAAAYTNRGVTLQQLKRPEEALSSYEQALRLDPADAEAWYARGGVLAELERPAEAEVSYQRALQLRPDYAEAHRNRGELHWQHARHESALASYDSALAARPDLPLMYGTWLHARMNVCEWGDWQAHTAELVARIERGVLAAQPFNLFPLVDSPPLHCRVAADFVRETCPPGNALPPPAKRSRDGRIRVGYYSADYREHPVAHLTAPLFERHDRRRFELTGFSFGPNREDAMSARLRRGFDRFIDVRRQTDREVALLSRELGIDIAVDLTGFTAHHRSGIFGHRAAPVQVNYLGYPGTTAAPYMDYILADRVLIPPEARAHYTEQVVYLPHSYQANEAQLPLTDTPHPRAQLGLPEAGFVFCSFNNAYKITPEVFAGWMRILGAVPGSVLWLMRNTEIAAANLRGCAVARGVSPERLVFAERVPLLAEHLARYAAADLFLDTFPYNAHTTASDALGSGLPVLSRPGRSFASRVAASLLHNVGLPELLAADADHYERLAVELAHDPARLRALRERLNSQRTTAPLFDLERFTRDLEAAYTRMHERCLAGLPPADIRV